MQPIFFAASGDFRRWLEEHHETETELLVGFYKKSSGRPSMTWPESVAEALCYGWIDGIRRKIDDERYSIRFTPRRPGSSWSKLNVRTAESLIELGRMRPAGLRAYEARDPKKTGLYSFERGEVRLSREAEARFKSVPQAWNFFQSQPPGYRRTAVAWILSAKRESTRSRRLEMLIEDSSAGLRIKPMRRTNDE